jgi:hypothetical protein
MEEIEKSKEEEKSEKENESMTENLERLLKEITPNETVFSEADLDLPVEQDLETEGVSATSDTIQEEIVEEPVAEQIIKITSLEQWFERNANNIANINQVKVLIRGVDPKQTLIMSVIIPNGGKDADGNDRRTLKVFDNAGSIPVLDLTPLAMDIYSNGFRVIYQYDDNIFIKAYSVKTGIVCALCTQIDGKLLPYQIIKVSRKESEVKIPLEFRNVTEEKMNESAQLEDLQLLYKQSAKCLDKFTTNNSVVEWLIDRQKDIFDINHHLQIDDVIMNILK